MGDFGEKRGLRSTFSRPNKNHVDLKPPIFGGQFGFKICMGVLAVVIRK